MPRTRVFDVEEAIDIATELFWRQGYDRTSLSDLTQAIGITPPSFYHAFGSKEALFEKVVEVYRASHFRFFEDSLAQPTALGVAERYLHGSADAYTDPKHPMGCLGINNVLPSVDEKDGVRRILLATRIDMRRKLLSRFNAALASGDLPTSAKSEDLVRFLQVVSYGLSIEAQSGANRKALHRAVDVALRVWPPAKRTKSKRPVVNDPVVPASIRQADLKKLR
jgi:AcrR family transcriptional regulator